MTEVPRAKEGYDLDSVGGRLRYVMDRLDLEIADVERICDVTNKTVYRWLANESIPYGKYLRRLSSETGSSFQWLKTGAGEMLMPSQESGATAEEEVPAKKEARGQAEERVDVPVFGRASAGPGLVPPDEVERYERMTRFEFERTFGGPAPQNGGAGRYGFWEVRGDSAAPVYFENELVPVELVGPTQRFENDCLYVFRWDDSVMLKRLRSLPDGCVRAISLNPSIDPFLFRPNGAHEFAVLGRVIQPQKQQLYAALVGRAFAIRKRMSVVKGGSE